MVKLWADDLAWFNHALPNLNIKAGTTPAAEIFVTQGVHGIAQLHKAIKDRDIEKIQSIIDR